MSTGETVTLTTIADDEDNDGTDDTSYNAADICDVTVLAVGDVATCTFQRTLDTSQVATLIDVATGSAEDDDGNTATDSDDATVEVTCAPE